MKVVIRTDSSVEIGSGHVMRCLTLSEHLRNNGAEVRFVCRDLPGTVGELIERRGFDIDRLPEPEDRVRNTAATGDEYAHWLGVDWRTDAEQTCAVLKGCTRPDWLLIDHYGLDFRWQEQLQAHTRAIMVIDDLANRRHCCDLLVDHNLSAEGAARYGALTPEGATVLCGPQYALLRQEFVQAAANLRRRDGRVKRILLFFGGIDRSGQTLSACRAIEAGAGNKLDVDVVVGASNPHRAAVQEFCDTHPRFKFHCQVDCMASLMNAADLALGAGGTTTWERAWLGLPSVILPVADNQISGSRAMAAAGAAWVLQPDDPHVEASFSEAVAHALEHPAEVRTMGRKARDLFGEAPVPGVNLVGQAMREAVRAQA